MMIASTSHDMKTPLNTILNMIGLIKTRSHDDLILKWCRVANNSSKLLLYLVTDTLDYFMIKSQKFKLRIVKFDLMTLI
jgi:signal transduction histidine kinase